MPCSSDGTLRKFNTAPSSWSFTSSGMAFDKATCAHVMNRHNRDCYLHLAGFRHRPAAVNDFLTAAFHLGIVTLHGRKVQAFIKLTTIHRTCRATAKPTAWQGPLAQSANRLAESDFFHQIAFDITVTTGNHNRFVIAAHLAAILVF